MDFAVQFLREVASATATLDDVVDLRTPSILSFRYSTTAQCLDVGAEGNVASAFQLSSDVSVCQGISRLAYAARPLNISLHGCVGTPDSVLFRATCSWSSSLGRLLVCSFRDDTASSGTASSGCVRTSSGSPAFAVLQCKAQSLSVPECRALFRRFWLLHPFLSLTFDVDDVSVPLFQTLPTSPPPGTGRLVILQHCLRFTLSVPHDEWGVATSDLLASQGPLFRVTAAAQRMRSGVPLTLCGGFSDVSATVEHVWDPATDFCSIMMVSADGIPLSVPHRGYFDPQLIRPGHWCRIVADVWTACLTRGCECAVQIVGVGQVAWCGEDVLLLHGRLIGAAGHEDRLVADGADPDDLFGDLSAIEGVFTGGCGGASDSVAGWLVKPPSSASSAEGKDVMNHICQSLRSVCVVDIETDVALSSMDRDLFLNHSVDRQVEGALHSAFSQALTRLESQPSSAVIPPTEGAQPAESIDDYFTVQNVDDDQSSAEDVGGARLRRRCQRGVCDCPRRRVNAQRTAACLADAFGFVDSVAMAHGRPLASSIRSLLGIHATAASSAPIPGTSGPDIGSFEEMSGLIDGIAEDPNRTSIVAQQVHAIVMSRLLRGVCNRNAS
eukprot:TRINITY_DN70607_c0_g1_i1.p1 TRINITY_DN70607_c0_g1~~TRINITY_DN70607_c0_g1_i1.p1  ORF type:complete len:611 (-),score=9.18 TRINITY_DN70607_c0_g1_i1:86-1918(-)